MIYGLQFGLNWYSLFEYFENWIGLLNVPTPNACSIEGQLLLLLFRRIMLLENCFATFERSNCFYCCLFLGDTPKSYPPARTSTCQLAETQSRLFRNRETRVRIFRKIRETPVF